MPSNFSNIPVYSAADLLRYAMGRMTAQEMHALEKAAMEDPFLVEALEGFHTAAETNTQPVLQQQIERLKPATQQKEEQKIIPLWRKKVFQYAAAAVFVIAGGWLTYALVQQNGKSNDQNISIASAPESGSAATAPVVADSVAKSNSSADTVLQNQAPNSTPIQGPQDSYANAERYAYEPPPLTPLQKETQQRAATIVKDSILPVVADNTNAPIDLAGKNAVKDQSVAEVATNATSPVTKTEASPGKALAKRKADDESDRFMRSSNTTQPQYVFKGRVTDAKNNPLPYANVMVTGEEIGTYTDSKGNFNLIYDDSILPVRTRSLGYESQTVQMKPGNREQQIIMPEDEKLKESLALTVQKPQAKQAGYKPLIIETDSLSSAQPVVSLFDYNTYLLNNNRISELPQASRSVELSFEVNKRGEVKNITVEQSSGKALDTEAIRLLKEGPKWKPNNGGTGRARVKVKL